MTSSFMKMTNTNKSKFHQVIWLDAEGFIYDSCESVFDTSEFRENSVGEYFHFFASELENILNSEADKITFSQMQTSLDCLPGFYDYTFSKKILNEKTYILWEVFDYTSVYKEYVKVQQIKNELDIQNQFITHQKELQNKKNEHSSKFFQTEYVSKQKSQSEELIRKLVYNKFGSPESLTYNKDNPSMDLHYLRGHLEILIDEIDLFLDQTKVFEDKEVEIRTFINNLFSNNSEAKVNNITLDFGESLPEKINVNKTILSQILTLMCVSELDDKPSSESSLTVDNIQGETPRLSLKFIETFTSAENLDDFHTKRTIKLSIIKSLVSILGGDISSSFEVSKSRFELLVSLEYK